MEPNKPFPIYQLMDAFEAFTHGEPAAKPQHRSLYYYLLARARKLGNVVSYSLPYENGMHGSGIGSWATYDAALKMLHEWGFIVYTPGANRFKTPVVAIQFRNPTDDVLLTYWQSYSLSTSNPIDSSTGDNNRLIEVGKKRIEELETENKAVVAAADAAADEAEKKRAALEKENEALKAELLSLTAQRPASHTRGPALQFPDWATDAFRAEWDAWVAYRQSKRDKLKPASMQKMLDKLAAFDEGYCKQLFDRAISNGYTGLVFDDTPLKYAHYLQAQNNPNHAASSHFQQSERGAKPTANAAFGARALSAQLRAIREQRGPEVGGVVHLGPTAGTNPHESPVVATGFGAPQG